MVEKVSPDAPRTDYGAPSPHAFGLPGHGGNQKIPHFGVGDSDDLRATAHEP
jgi:hypothetical protein